MSKISKQYANVMVAIQIDGDEPAQRKVMLQGMEIMKDAVDKLRELGLSVDEISLEIAANEKQFDSGALEQHEDLQSMVDYFRMRQ